MAETVVHFTKRMNGPIMKLFHPELIVPDIPLKTVNFGTQAVLKADSKSDANKENEVKPEVSEHERGSLC